MGPQELFTDEKATAPRPSSAIAYRPNDRWDVVLQQRDVPLPVRGVASLHEQLSVALEHQPGRHLRHEPAEVGVRGGKQGASMDEMDAGRTSQSSAENYPLLHIERRPVVPSSLACSPRAQVYAGYCSSDAWMGNTTTDTPGPETFGARVREVSKEHHQCPPTSLCSRAPPAATAAGYHFRGARILRAILGALVQIHQMGQFAGHKLLLVRRL